MKKLSFLFVILTLVIASGDSQSPAQENIRPHQAGVADHQQTALDRYIAKPDDVYQWELVSTIEGEQYTAFVLELTSQQWRSKFEVDRPVWKHWLTITRPDEIKSSQALLYIGGGRNGSDVPSRVSASSLRLALETGAVVADLGMVPNQPLHFADSRGHGRREDDLIAYSRVKSIITGDDEWLARLAMVKSGVRAMDAVQEFMASDDGGQLQVDKFIVAGGSKRAWTTWLVGAVDTRVIGIIPLVIDALNTEAITRHHYEAYGFFSPSLGDYVRHGLYPQKLGSTEFARILRIEDPYMYRDRSQLRIPKYVINATGDQYFLPDNSQYYFRELPDVKLLRYVPNAKHNLAGSDARDSMIAFFEAVTHGRRLPRYTWTIASDDSIHVQSKDTPRAVRIWQATNPDARDFRLDTIGKAWTSTPLPTSSPSNWIAKVDPPPQGFTAFMVELEFDSGGKYPLKVTTDVQVVPDVVPYAGEKLMPYLGKRPNP